ncbi:MAG: CoA ester lyase [Pseudomonadota bacterium]
MRSWLFIPGDSEKKLAKAAASPADIIIFDLEDSVAEARKPVAREMVREAIASVPGRAAVRINPLTSGLADDDLAVVMAAAPDIIVLPKSERGADVADLSVRLAVLEAQHGLDDGATTIMAITTETAQALFGLGSYRGASQRLTGMAWGAEDLSTVLGALRTRDGAGEWTNTFQLARTLCLAGAVAAGVQPIDTIYADFRDAEGFAVDCAAAAADGFLGKMAIHPAQVELINAAFTPTETAIAEAQAIVDAFAAAPDAGTIGLDGRMIDRPHLVKAEALLARAKTYI